MGVWSWLSGLFAPSGPAVMYRPGWTPGSRVRLYWAVTQLDVYLETDSPEAEEAVTYWNGVIGRRFFAPPMLAPTHTLAAFADEKVRAGMEGQILVRVDPTVSDHGDTRHEYDRRTGRAISAVVTLPGTSHRPFDVARHEFGHCLTLDHARDGTLMGPRLPPIGTPVPLDEAQARLVRSWR